MKDIKIIRNALGLRYSICSEEFKALNHIELLLEEAPKFFSHHDFDGEKLDWLKRAGQLEDNENEPNMITRS